MGARVRSALAFVLGVSLVVASIAIDEAQAATYVDFLVPRGTPIEGGVAFDSFTVTGRSVGWTTAGSCEFGGPFPIQNGVLVPGRDSTGGATRLTGIVVLTTSEIAPGTRFYPLEPVSSCTGEGGLEYDKWRGQVGP